MVEIKFDYWQLVAGYFKKLKSIAFENHPSY